MTVALPILSACEQETCILPSAVLSTHTGGFGRPHVVHLDAHLQAMADHWKENGITFDAVLVGYLGSVEAVAVASNILDTMLAPDGISIVDPAMADHGKMYSGLSPEYARKMEALCRKADIMLPNLTEAAMFAGVDYKEDPQEPDVEALLEKLNHPCVVLTGIGYEADQTGIAVYEHGRYFHIPHKKISRSFHGTGDMFAAAFTGALMYGKEMKEAASIASEFVLESICRTVAEPAHWYGVKFETALKNLNSKLHDEKTAE